MFQPGVPTRIDEPLLCEYVSRAQPALGSPSLVRGDSILPLAKLASLTLDSRSLSLSHHLQPGPRHLRTEVDGSLQSCPAWAKEQDMQVRPVHRNKGHIAAVQVGIGVCQDRPRQRLKHDARARPMPPGSLSTAQASTVLQKKICLRPLFRICRISAGQSACAGFLITSEAPWQQAARCQCAPWQQAARMTL